MPSATLEDIALRSTNPVSRAIDVICVIMLQLLTLLVVANEPDPHKRRNHPALGSHTILARLEAGEDFDLPRVLVKYLRAAAGQIRAGLERQGFGEEHPSAPIQAEPQNSPAAAKARPERPITRQAAPAAPGGTPQSRQTPRPDRQAAIPGVSKEEAFSPGVSPRQFRCGIVTTMTWTADRPTQPPGWLGHAGRGPIDPPHAIARRLALLPAANVAIRARRCRGVVACC
jgi:hypothetical protein